MSSSGAPSPAAITIRSWACLISKILLPFVSCALVATLLWVHVSVIACYIVAALAGIPLLYRACRHGVRFDDSGITVRNLWRTDKLSWHDVSRFSDGRIRPVRVGEGSNSYFWAVQIVLNSGRSVAAEGTMRDEKHVAKVLATMEQVAASWQIPAQLTGKIPDQPLEGRPPRLTTTTARNRPGAPTFVTERKPRWFGIIITALYGVVVLWPLAADRYRLGTGKWTPKWAMHVAGTAFTAVLAVVAVAVICGWVRAWRIGLRLDSQGVTVRNYFRTYRFDWAEVTSLVDGSVMKREYWALSLLAADGRAVTASGTASQFKAYPETLTAIRQTAESHGIAARLTGLPGDWRGPKWQSQLLRTLVRILPLLFLVDLFLVGGSAPCNGGCGGA